MAVPAFDHELEERLQRLHLLPSIDLIQTLPANERIEALAQLIQMSDDLLASLPPEMPEDPDILSAVRLLTRMVRTMAFQFMREVNRDQAWFWTEDWQAGEREVDVNQAAGRGTFLDSDKAFDVHLRALRPDLADIQH